MKKKIFLSLLITYALLGFFLVPYIFKTQAISIVSEQTTATLELDSVSFNPFVFKLKLSGIKLKDKEEKELLWLESAYADVELYSLFRKALHIKEFTLSEPRISLVYEADKTLNFLSLLKEDNETQEDTNSTLELPRIIINSIKIEEGRLSYRDNAKQTPFDFSLENIGFEIKDIDTKFIETQQGALRLYSLLGDGGFLDLKCQVHSIEPLILQGNLAFESGKLYTEYRYIQDMLNLEVADGDLTLYADYFFNLDELNATKIDKASIFLKNLRIKPKANHHDVLKLATMHIDGIEVLPMQQDVRIGKIELDALSLNVARNEKGEIDWLKYIAINLPPEVTEIVKEIDDAHESNTTEEKSWNVVVEEIALRGIKADFIDKNIKPSVVSKINKLNFYAKNISLAGEAPLHYMMDARINDSFECNSAGDVKHAKLDINASLKCKGLNLVHYNPYIDTIAKELLSVYNIKLMRVTVGFGADIRLKEQKEQMFISLKKTNFQLSDFVLNKKDTNEKLLAFSKLDLSGANVDLQKKEVDISKVELNDFEILAKMSAKGVLNLEGLIETKPTPKANPKKSTKSKKETKTKDEDFRVKLKHFALNSAKAEFEDATLSPKTTTKIDKFFANVYDIDSKEGTWIKYKTSARINSKGVVKSDGNLRLSPLTQSGTLDVSALSLKEFNPYLAQTTYLKIDDGAIDAKLKTRYEPLQKKADIKLTGEIKLKEFFLTDERKKSSLLSLGELALEGFDLELMPNRLHIQEANLEAFYVDAMIDEKKVMNFTKLLKNHHNENKTQVKAPKTSQTTEEDFVYKIEKLNLNSGSANFADFSLPIKFQTNIHHLGGTLLSISNTPGEVTHVDIAGEVDKYGSTKLFGSLESGAPKKFMDLSFNFKNLELNAMSGYSMEFAGYAIDSGKLYLDLGYKIKDSQLLGSNNIVIKKIKLGKEIKDPNKSSMPLGFVVALLEDSDGVIDIDMPIAGNVDEPDFKYGTLVLKTFGNLMLKAVTSPFTFLGKLLGIEAQKLEYISFEPGKSEILPPQREKLDEIEKMLTQRPKMSLALNGVYDVKSDKKALQVEKLKAYALKKKGAKTKEEKKNALDIDILEDILSDAKPGGSLDVIRNPLKEKYKDDEYKREYFKALVEETRLLQVLESGELEALAQERSENIASYLLQEDKLDFSRIHRKEITTIDEPKNSDVRMKLNVDVQ